MVAINNSAVTKQLSEVIQLQQTEGVPNQLSNTVVPTLNVNPKYTCFARHALGVNAASTTLYTCDSNKRTFFHGGTLGYIKDATSTSTFQTLTISTVDGTSSVRFLILPSLTLTTGASEISLSTPPIELAKGSTITITASSATANITVSGSAILHEEEDPN